MNPKMGITTEISLSLSIKFLFKFISISKTKSCKKIEIDYWNLLLSISSIVNFKKYRVIFKYYLNISNTS